MVAEKGNIEAKVTAGISRDKDHQAGEPKPSSTSSGCGCERCRWSGRMCSVVDGMANMVPRAVVDNLLSANSDMAKECSRRWLEAEELKSGQLISVIQVIARCVYVIVVALALFGVTYNLKGCSSDRVRSLSRAETVKPEAVSATNYMQMTSTYSIQCDKR